MSLTRTVIRFAAPLPRIEDSRRILFIGPHPDDIEIGAGATAAKLAAAGKKLCFLICIMISDSIGAQSVCSCGIVSCTALCGSHSAGIRLVLLVFMGAKVVKSSEFWRLKL